MSQCTCVHAVVAVNVRKMEGSRVADTLASQVSVRAVVVVDARRVSVCACVCAMVITCKCDGNDQ